MSNKLLWVLICSIIVFGAVEADAYRENRIVQPTFNFKVSSMTIQNFNLTGTAKQVRSSNDQFRVTVFKAAEDNLHTIFVAPLQTMTTIQTEVGQASIPLAPGDIYTEGTYFKEFWGLNSGVETTGGVLQVIDYINIP